MIGNGYGPDTPSSPSTWSAAIRRAAPPLRPISGHDVVPVTPSVRRIAVHPRATAMIVRDDTIEWIGAADDAQTDAVDSSRPRRSARDPGVRRCTCATPPPPESRSPARPQRQPFPARGARRLEAHCRSRAGRIVIGHGWDESHWPEQRGPLRSELDRASYGGVVYLSRTDVHSAAVSSALVAAAPQMRTLDGFDDQRPLTGAAHHAARAAVYGSLTPQDRLAAQRATRARAAELGIGCLHELADRDLQRRRPAQHARTSRCGTRSGRHWLLG